MRQTLGRPWLFTSLAGLCEKRRASRVMMSVAGTGIRPPHPVQGQPGDNVTPKSLREKWFSMPDEDVVGFYGHGPKAGIIGCFSNFFIHTEFTFVVPPEFFKGKVLPEERRRIPCTFSEKAIMLCKAAAMGDLDTFQKIEKCKNPKDAKMLGRKVKDFSQKDWTRIVCSVAFQVVYQKFAAQTPQGKRFRDILFSTGESTIAEATVNDQNWGIGLNQGDPDVNRPRNWLGTNILGWALMETREALRQEEREPHRPRAVATPQGVPVDEVDENAAAQSSPGAGAKPSGKRPAPILTALANSTAAKRQKTSAE